jgi:long-chain acyl-CoA synthetase
MNFWDATAFVGGTQVVVDEHGRSVTRNELNDRVTSMAIALRRHGDRLFGFLLLRNNLDGLVAYLAALRAGHVPLLLSADLPAHLLERLYSHYEPDWLLAESVEGEVLLDSQLRLQVPTKQSTAKTEVLHPDLALLLSTSGSTGSPKLVRLSYGALQANATSIAQYLGIQPDDRALTLLPPNYSYGLSVINSHLVAGATLVLRDLSVMTPAFSQILKEESITSIPGVPYVYQMLHRVGFDKWDLPALRTITQAGGRLDDRLIRNFAKLASDKGWRFFVMYGQTEATARISYVPPQRLLDKVGSIGIPIPGGLLAVDEQTNELIYTGPNVMMGYAESRSDLALGDLLAGTLNTGDLARQDEDGFFYVTGRLKRFVKLAGNRISLDEVEEKIQTALAHPAAVGGRDERMVVWLEGQEEDLVHSCRDWLQQQYGLHHSMFRIRLVPQLSLLPTGKKNYEALMEDA